MEAPKYYERKGIQFMKIPGKEFRIAYSDQRGFYMVKPGSEYKTFPIAKLIGPYAGKNRDTILSRLNQFATKLKEKSHLTQLEVNLNKALCQ